MNRRARALIVRPISVATLQVGTVGVKRTLVQNGSVLLTKTLLLNSRALKAKLQKQSWLLR